MTKAQESELAQKLKGDIKNGGRKAFHNHVAQAILKRVSDDDIKKAIKENEEDLAAKYRAETGRDLNIDEYIANELSNQHFMAIFGGLDEEEIDD